MVYLANEKTLPDEQRRHIAEQAVDRWSSGYGTPGSNYGFAKVKRLEIGMENQFSLRSVAEILRHLATRLDVLARDTGRDPRIVRLEADSAIRLANQEIKEATRSGMPD